MQSGTHFEESKLLQKEKSPAIACELRQMHTDNAIMLTMGRLMCSS